MKKCSNCGMQLRDEDVFCSGCGRKYVEEIDYSFYGTPKRVIEEREEAERIERDEDVAFYGEATKRPEVVFEICKGVVCPICKGPICEGDVFCINCGSKVESVSEASAKEEPDKKYCMNCGKPLSSDDIFCMNCGTKAQTPAIEEPALKEPDIIKEPQEAIKAEPIAAEPIIEEPAKKYCMNCGSLLNSDDIFCMNCGTKAEAAEPVAQETIIIEEHQPIAEEPKAAFAVQEPEKKYCMNCGTPLSTDDVFCMNCGAKAEELTEEIKAEPIIEEPAPVAIPEAEKKAEDRVSSECGIRVCAKCGAKIESGYNFCIMCGSVCDIPASNESSCVNGEKPVCGEDVCSAKQEMDKTEPEKKAEAYIKERVCTNCGSRIEEGYLFCIRCGTKYESEPTVTKDKFCTNCGAKAGENSVFCEQCGIRL